MAGTTTNGGRVAVEGAVVVPTVEAGTVTLVSIIKFLRLLNR